MSNLVYNTYGAQALSGGLLDNVVKAVVDAKEAATSKKEMQTVDVLFRGHRVDIVWGKIMVIPPQVCDDFKNIPTPLLKGALVRLYDGEQLAEYESCRLAESEFDELDADKLQDFKRKMFQTEGNRFVPVLLFVPAWTSPRDWAVMKWDNDESKLKTAIAHLCFSCYYDPRFSKLFNELVTTEGKLDLKYLQDSRGLSPLFQDENREVPALEKRASVVRGVIAANLGNLDQIKNEVHTEELEPSETEFFDDLAGKIEDKVHTPATAAKQANMHSFIVPGAVLQEFYPEIEQGILKYPVENNSGMPEPKLDTSGGPAAETLSPGKPTTTQETVPLRREMQLRGPGFAEDFYRSVVNIAPGSLMMAASKKTAAPFEMLEVIETSAPTEKEELTSILQGVCGEIATTLIAAFKVTSRPLAIGVPGEGKVGLANDAANLAPISTQQDFFLPERLKALCAKLNDRDLQDVVNESWSQAAVWCASTSGGFTYEVLVRAESFDDETLTLKYKYVTNKK